MLKVRIIPTLLYKDFGLVKGRGFDSWRRVGAALQAINVYSLRQVDELVFLDITATRDGRRPDFDLVDELADHCFMPLTVGGGVHTLDDVRELLRVGADKVAVNTAAVEDPGLVRAMADRFGSQCVVVSMDYRRNEGAASEVYIRAGTQATGLDPVAWARQVAGLGAGEILLTAIDRDGTMSGYDLETLRAVSDAVAIPVIASGGAGSAADVLAAVTEGGAAAAAAGAVFHFTELTPREIKEHLHRHGVPVRL